jgi:hypothetical protein
MMQRLVLPLLIAASMLASAGSAGAQTGRTQVTAGDEWCFTLTARDANGDAIRDWNRSGNITTLTLHNSSAATDSSTRTWNGDPLGFSWSAIRYNGMELSRITTDRWALPAAYFNDSGNVRLCLVVTAADTGVYVEVSPFAQGLTQTTGRIDVIPGPAANFRVELAAQTATGRQVFYLRPYEITVTPRDRYLNTATRTVAAQFTARWPGEFDSHAPGLSGIFGGEVFITGPTTYLLASRVIRELPYDEPQWIMCYASASDSIQGRTPQFEVLSHAPAPFALLLPTDHSFIAVEWSQKLERFTWERPSPPDPYTGIRVSPSRPVAESDTVRYEWTLVDSISLTHAVRFPSDSGGLLPSFTVNHGYIPVMMKAINAGYDVMAISAIWYVAASDGIFTTFSSPPFQDARKRPGFGIHFLIRTGLDSPEPPSSADLALLPNSPNPFSSSTTVRFSLPQRAGIRLDVYDLLGARVATLADGELEAGTHSARFDGSALPAGVYVCRLTTGDRVLTRRMTLVTR